MKAFTITSDRREKLFLAILFLVTILPRFIGLGFSEFYGDETKTFYWNKSISAREFLLDQRKGPVQFLAVWAMEKLAGDFDPFFVRLPFAAAGALSVFVLYIVVRKWFGVRTAGIAAFLFSINGLFIAFSRTAQYQSLLWLFGFLAILFVQNKKYFWSGLFLGLGFLSHYDAVFFAVPVILELLRSEILKRPKDLLLFILPVMVLVASFYLPYLLKGYFEANTVGYVSRRIGVALPLAQTFQTYNLYNPFVLSIPIILLGLGAIRKNLTLTAWFLVPFIAFELFFRDSGTHIQQYLIPLIIMSAVVIDRLISYSSKFEIDRIVVAGFLIAGCAWFYYNSINFIPAFNRNYPWRQLENTDSSRGLYIYGFPYNRGWKSVAEHLKSNGAKTFYTNDNVTVAEWYLLGIPAVIYEPEFYIEISWNRLFRPLDERVFGRYEYVLDTEIEINGRDTAKIYRRFWKL